MKAHLIVAGLALSSISYAQTRQPPHLELDMTGADYRVLMDRLAAHENFAQQLEQSELQPILDTGKRLLDWVDRINAQRPAGQMLELSSPATQAAGIPIDKPRIYNRAIVQQQYDTAVAALPQAMADVLLGTGALSDTAPVDDATFLERARAIDNSYQYASRWLLMEPYLTDLAERSVDDVRGYYFLSQEPGLTKELAGWQTLDSATKDRLAPLLVGFCHNGGATTDSCTDELHKNETQKSGVASFYSTYEPQGQKLYTSFFKIEKSRPDVAWTSAHASEMRVPFLTPDNQAVTNWLRDNIEDEWQLGDWHLRLDFRADGTDDLPHVVFEAGSTPHVNDIAGNIITMDANRSINEYSARWTIRHEYGHVLGFPDCYVEYYDEGLQAMVNYQLDITNLMCSRAGHLKQVHVDELRRAYFKD